MEPPLDMQYEIPENETVDDEVLTAGKAAYDSGRITPLLKVELWAKIQSRRLSEGKGEMQVKFTEPPETPLSASDKLRLKQRRESNRVAAQKCRRKKKESKKKLEEIRKELEEKNKTLKDTITYLEEQKQAIIQKLYGQPQQNDAMQTSDYQQIQKTLSEEPELSAKEEEDEEELRDMWYFNSSQEVPTAASPPPPEPFSIESPPPARATYMTTPILSDTDDMMDDRWLGNSFVNLENYLE